MTYAAPNALVIRRASASPQADARGRPVQAVTTQAVSGWFAIMGATERAAVASSIPDVAAVVRLPLGTAVDERDQIDAAGARWDVVGVQDTKVDRRVFLRREVI